MRSSNNPWRLRLSLDAPKMRSIAERIEVAEITACVFEAEVVGAVQNLGAAQLIGEPLPE